MLFLINLDIVAYRFYGSVSSLGFANSFRHEVIVLHCLYVGLWFSELLRKDFNLFLACYSMSLSMRGLSGSTSNCYLFPGNFSCKFEFKLVMDLFAYWCYI